MCNIEAEGNLVYSVAYAYNGKKEQFRRQTDSCSQQTQATYTPDLPSLFLLPLSDEH